MTNDNPTVETLPVPDTNAFFGDGLAETISRVTSVMQLVQDIENLRLEARNEECARLSNHGAYGLHVMLECAKAALAKEELTGRKS